MIRVVFLTDQNVYHFNLTSTGEYEINGQIINVSYGDYPNGLTSETVPEIFKIVRTVRFQNYKNVKTGEIIDIETYNRMLSDIKQLGVYDDDTDQIVFDDLDHEFTYRKFLRDWDQNDLYEKVEKNKLDINVVHGMISSGSPYIIPVYNINSANPSLFSFRRAALEIDTVRQWAKEKNIKVDIPGHGHLEFIKIDGEYVFNKLFKLPAGFDNNNIIVGFDEAKSLLDSIPKKIIERLDNHVRKIEHSGINVNTFIDALYFLKERIKGLKPTAQHECIEKINMLIGELKNSFQVQND
jgi:hypothetical protein